jgi:hypothetical protein
MDKSRLKNLSLRTGADRLAICLLAHCADAGQNSRFLLRCEGEEAQLQVFVVSCAFDGNEDQLSTTNLEVPVMENRRTLNKRI